MTTDPTIACAPACAPNLATAIPGKQPSSASSALAPALNIPVTTEQCGGTTAELAHSVVKALIPAGTVIYTKKCPSDSEFDTVTLCTPGNNPLPIFLVMSYSSTGLPTSTAYNADGTIYVGSVSALVPCGANSESDPLEMCDNTTPFIRWVVKNNGAPTGTTFDTTLTGTPYTPSGIVLQGRCPLPEPSPPNNTNFQDLLVCVAGNQMIKRTTRTFDNYGAEISSFLEFIDNTGSVVASPALYSIGLCPVVSPIYVDFEDVFICATGEQMIQRTTRTFSVNGVELSNTVEYIDGTGTVVSTPLFFTLGTCPAIVLVNESKFAVIAGLDSFDFSVELAGASLISYTISLIGTAPTVGKIDGVKFPAGSYSWEAEAGATISNAPLVEPDVQAIIQWVQR
jgi:hypothetical protein